MSTPLFRPGAAPDDENDRMTECLPRRRRSPGDAKTTENGGGDGGGAAAEAAMSCYQLSDDRTRGRPPLYGGREGSGRGCRFDRDCPGRRLAGVYRATLQRAARDEIFGFYTFIVPRGDAPERRRRPDNLRDAYTVN